MKTYAEKLRDPRWQKKRLEIMSRDQFKCRECGCADKTLNIHHCFYEKGDPWNTADSFLLTLCEECHEQRQEIENDAKRMLGQIFAASSDIETLRAFVTSMAAAVQNPNDEPTVAGSMERDWNEDIRWFNFAADNPGFRPMYEAVVGRKVDWPTR